MKNFSISKLFAVALCLMVNSYANAGYILNGSLDIETLNIAEDGESFYNYTSGSPNTGFEENETLVFFLSEFNSSTYLFGLIDSPTSTTSGKLNLNFTDSSALPGTFTFVDEPKELTNSSLIGDTRSFFFKWGANYGDGFVYDIGGTEGTDITLDFFRLNGVEQYKFLSFDDQGNQFSLLSGNTDQNLLLNISYATTASVQANDIPAPSSIGLLSIAIVVLGFRARSRK